MTTNPPFRARPRGSSPLPLLPQPIPALDSDNNNVVPLRRGREVYNVPPTPFMEWGEFTDMFRGAWEQGQHITMIGTTGSGKTTLVEQFIGLRHYVAVFGVKGRDDTMERFVRDHGYTRVKTWTPELDDYLVLWPDIKGHKHTDKQRDEFARAMDSIYREGGWCVVFDEVSYLSDTLRMDGQLKFLLQQGRSSGISIVAMTQRPAFIPLAFYDQATHLFVWRDNDLRNRQRIGELAGNARYVVESEVAQLRRREVLYLHKDSGYRVRTIVEV